MIGPYPARLATEGDLRTKWPAFDALRADVEARWNSDILDAPVEGPSLKSYLLLTEATSLIADLDFSPLEIFYSRCYWLIRYARLREATAGFDAGLEQQIFQLVESADLAEGADWDVLEGVWKRAECDAAEQLANLPAD